MSEHTPAPWKWCGNDIEPEDWSHPSVMSPSVSCGAYCYGGMVELGITEANAKHIVHCVNNHERLVEALEDCCEALEYEHAQSEEVRQARALLAELDGEMG